MLLMAAVLAMTFYTSSRASAESRWANSFSTRATSHEGILAGDEVFDFHLVAMPPL
jgi:hypothetical protein